MVNKLVEYLSNKSFNVFLNNVGFDIDGDIIDNSYEEAFNMVSVNVLTNMRLVKVVKSIK